MRAVVFVLAAVLAAAVVSADAANKACSGAAPTPTVTFVKTCTTISVAQAACWTPRAPLWSDVVLFPAGTAAAMPFAYLYTPLNVSGVVVAAGATVQLLGGAIQVAAGGCIAVQGTLQLLPSAIDKGAVSTVAFLPDASVPLGTDCAFVPRGFTPRVCGPGGLRVFSGGVLQLKGLYASLWTATTVDSGAMLKADTQSFLWGNVTNNGVITSNGAVYLHGQLNNNGAANFLQIRADRWATSFPNPNPPIVIVNNGWLNVSSTGAPWYDFISTDVSAYGGNYQLQILNYKNVSFNAVLRPMAFAGIDLVVHNFGGLRYSGAQNFYSTGETINHGTLIADGAYVYLNSYLSDNGELVTLNGGWFNVGAGSGVDTKTAVLCKRSDAKQHLDKLRDDERKMAARPLKALGGGVKSVGVRADDSHIVRTNQTCDPQTWGSCPYPLCCGTSGVCETANCQNADGYGGGPMCCLGNAFCGGSSHGAYCGNGIFNWEVDTECLESDQYVDRYEWEAMRARFAAVPLPRFGRHRYSLRGASRIAGDGTGAVIFNEPLELRGADATLVVGGGGVLRAVFDNSARPFAGDGRVVVAAGGQYSAGVRATYDAATRIAVEAGGAFVVADYATIFLRQEAPLRVAPGGTLRIDGRLMTFAAPAGAPRAVRHCGETEGRGAAIGEFALGSTCTVA